MTQSPARGGLSVAVLTVPSDPIGRSSPLATQWRERLAALPGLEAAHVFDHGLPAFDVGPTGLRSLGDLGRALARGWPEARRPDLLLCDGYQAAVVAFAIAGRCGGRVVLWLGTDSLPVGRSGVRVARATALAALAVVASSQTLVDRLSAARLSRNIALVPPLDLTALASQREPRRFPRP